MEFRDAVKYLRSELGLTQVELAMGLNINAITVGRWENGRTLPTRSITSALLEFARTKGASKECLDMLSRAINAAAKNKLDFSGKSLYAVEHASLRELIDGASYPIYVCDMETDDILYLNRAASELIGTDVSAVGRKCYECLMLRSAPCEFCHKTELVEDVFKDYDVRCALNGATYRVQGKLLSWNGRRAHVKCILGNAVSSKQQPSETEATAARLLTIFENINGGISVVVYEDDGTVRIAFANDRYYELFGYTKAQFERELKGRTPNAIHPDDWGSAAAAIARVKETKQAATFRYRIIKRDKSIAYVRCNSSFTSFDGLSNSVLISILTDITESVKLEQQAIVSGQRLDAIMKNMNSAVTASIIKSDGTLEILFTNDLHHQMLGYTREQYQAEVPDPFGPVHPDDVDAVREAVFSLRHIGDEKEMQYRIFTRDGKIKTLEMHISMMTFPDAEGPVQLAVHMDVTDTAEAQQQLAAQHKQIAGLLNDTPSGLAIIEVDPNDIVGTLHTTYYNDRFISFSGYGRDEYDVLLKENEMAFVFKEDLPALLADTKKICAGEIGASADTTVRCHTKSGGYRWLLLTGQLTEQRGNTCVIHIAMVDITERQKAIDRLRISDEMLRIAAETDQRALVIYNVKDNSCRVESRLLFSAKYGETIGNIPQSIIDLGIIAADSEEELRTMFARIRNGEKEIRISLQLRSGPDKYEWYECNAATIFDAEGLPDHAVLVFHNITEQRMKEAVFIKWQQSIETRPLESYTLFRCNLSRDASLDTQSGSLLKISFPSDAMSFNSRTTLYAETCVYPDDREVYVKLLDSDTLLTMFYRGEHFASLDYRETAENGEVMWRRLTIETVEYPDTADVQAFLMYEDIHEEKIAEIAALELAESDPLTCALNRGAFARKVNEIIDENPNVHCALIMLDMDGFKQLNDTFGHAAGDQALQEVAAVLRSYARSGDLVCRLGGDEFLVWLRDVPYDAVIGKTAQQICEHIRKAYSQEVLLSASAGVAVYPRDGHSYDELYPNADKALYKVKQSGKGSYAFFSVIGEEQTDAVIEALSVVRPAPQSPRGTKRRMLIVDDNEVSRMMLKGIFESEYLIESAKNGAEAMIRLRHFGVSISVVLLDILMPGVDGFSVLRRIQNDVDLRTIPVIVVTADAERATLLKAFELGAAEYVEKPIDVDIIRMRVQAVISKAESERLRAQNSYLMLQRDEEIKYRTVLESTGTVVVEYDWRNHVFIYDSEISKHIAGNFDHRGLWQVFLSDMVADSTDVKTMQDMLIALAGNRDAQQDSGLFKLKTPDNARHWFRTNIYKSVNDFGLAEKLIVTFNDVNDEVLTNEQLKYQATHDELTGLYNRAGFLEKATELIAAKRPGYYVMACIDIEKFKVINDQFGSEKGDEVLKHVANIVGGFFQRHDGLCCRYAADKFAVMYPATLRNSKELERNHMIATVPGCIPRPLRLCIGRCLINDTSLPISAMFDRASMAEAKAKGRYDTYIIDYDESMRANILQEQQIVGAMVDALKNGEFVPWFQPQYNHSTGALIGAEALVRWHRNGKIVPPNDFIPLFEKNGFIYEVDQSIWRQVCALLRRWLDEGKNPLPVSVNISRQDMFQENFIDVLTGLIAEYRLPAELLRLEITESAFSSETDTITGIAGKLISAGFTVEIDDFGSGYSSLNTLKDVPASILKLDMRFFEKTGDAKRGGNIVEAVVRMAKWLGMAVIAEGVEDKAQADYLKSIGCFYIQGYLYAQPMPTVEYEKLLDSDSKEAQLSRLQTLQDLDNNDFWDSRSMDTLIFNSYVGAACILELSHGKVEMLRATDHYARMLGDGTLDIKDVLAIDWMAHMDSRNISLFTSAVQESTETKDTVIREFEFQGLPGCPDKAILRSTLRVIATVGERHLIYCLSDNITAQRAAERAALNASERINAVMDNSHCGISAAIARADGSVELIFVNNRFFELLGYTKEQYAAEVKSPYDRVVPEDRERVVNTITKLNEIGSTLSMEVREMRRDGSIVWLRCDASVVKFYNIPDPVQISSFLDITRQKETELKQQESARQLEVVMSNINGGVSAIQVFDDATSKFVFNNDKYYDLYGYTREEAQAQSLDIMTLIHPEDLPGVMAKIKQLKADHQPCIIDYRITKKGGSQAMLRVNASLMSIPDYGDDVITSVVTDITERKSIEERLDAIVDNINGGISAIYLNKDKPEYVIANEQYYRLLGYTKEEFEAEHVNPFDLVHPDDREWVTKKFTKMRKYGERYTMEYRIIRHDGAVRNILCNTSVLKLFGIDEPLQLAVSNDITELRETQRKELAIKDRLNTVMNTMSNAITAVAFHDDGMEFLFANSRFYEMYGIRRGDIGADHLSNALDMILPEHRDAVRKAIRESVKTMETRSAEFRIQRPDGAVRWINVTINMTRLADINAPVMVAILSDITEEKQANDQIRFLNESASEILAQPDSDKAINNALQKLLQYFAGERAYIFELNDETQTSANTYEICAPGVTAEIQRLQRISYDTQQYWFDAFHKTGFVVISDVSTIDESEKALRDILLVQNIRSIIVAPLWRDGELIGYIGVDNPTTAVDQVNQLIALTDYVAVLLTRRDLMRKIRHDSETVQQLMDDTPGGFVRIQIFEDKNPTVISFNVGFSNMLGMSGDEVMTAYGDDAFKCLVAEDTAAVARDAAAALKAFGQYSLKCQLKKKDGTLLWVQMFGRSVNGENGERFINAYFTDITEQRNVEQLQSELLENLPFGAALYEFDGERIRVIHINKHYWELVGRSALSAEEISSFDVFHPDDRALVIDELKSAIRQERNAARIARILCGDGSYKPFSVVTNNVREKNGNYLLYVTFTRITDEEMAIQQMLPVALSTIVSNTDDMSYVKDKGLRYICVSQSVVEMAGATSPRDLIGKTAAEAFDRSFAEKFDEDDRLVVETGKPILRALEHLPTKDGSICLARTTKFPILDATGKAIGVYCISHDITAQKEKESQLELLTSTLPGGLATYSVSKEGIKTLYFNDGYYNYSGYTRKEYVELTKKEPLALMLAEDRQRMLNMVRGIVAEKKDGMTGTCTYRCRTKSGDIRWMSMKVVLSQISEDAYVLNAVQLDITERVNAEKRQNDLLDNLPFGAAMYEYDGKSLTAIHINKQYAEMVNREVNISLAGFAPTDAIHPDDRKYVLDEIRSAIREKRNAACDIRLLYGRDEYRLFHLEARIVRGENGKHMLYVAYERITDRDKELKETSEQLKLLSDSIPGGIATFRCMPGNVEPIYYNDGICALTGYSREEFDNSSVSVLDLIFDEDKPIIKKQIELLMSGETALDYSVRIHTKTGGYKWVECVAGVTGQESETVFLVSAVLTDVTEHQEERERLRVSEELSRLAIDQSGKIITRYDVAKRTLTLPYTLPSIYNIPRVLENMPEEQIRLGRISPDTAAAYRSVFERIGRGEATGEAVYQQASALGWRWLKSQFTTVFASDGRPVSAVISYEDITEQREKEAIYSRWQNAMAERAEDSYTLVRCNLNKSNITDSWDGSLLPVHFVDPAQSFNARTAEYTERFVYADDRTVFRAFLSSDTMLAEYHRGHRSDSIDYREQNEDGSLRWLRLTVDLVEYPDSTDVEAYLLFENIDEQKHAELSTIQRAETDPLTGVFNRTTFAQRVNQIISRFGTQTQHALFMLDVDSFKQVNDVFGHGAGDQILIDIANALTRVCRKDDLVGRLGGDEFFVFLSDIASAEVAKKKAGQLCDLTRKTLSVDVQVSTSIGIALHPQDGDDFEALYKAADKALYRTKNAGKDGYSFISGAPVINADARWHGNQSSAKSVIKQKQKTRRILIVDDNKMAQTALETILKDDYSIEKAMDGASALAVLQHYGAAISVVLLDLMMPGMSGFEVLEKMQQDERTHTIPVIVVSSDEERETALRVIRAGASDLITKPVDADLLRIRVRSAISKSENERLRAQNSYLAIRNTEVNSYRAALEHTGTMVIMLDHIHHEFSYSPAVSKKLAGQYDERPFWSILLSDKVTDAQTVQSMQQFVEAIANDKERTQGNLKVRLKTISGLSHMFELGVFKELDDYSLSSKMIMTLQEA